MYDSAPIHLVIQLFSRAACGESQSLGILQPLWAGTYNHPNNESNSDRIVGNAAVHSIGLAQPEIEPI